MPPAVITGWASGCGLALGRRCAAMGMDVALVADVGDASSVEEAAGAPICDEVMAGL